MTPREFSALRQVWLDELERQALMNAQVIATLYNAHFDNDGVPYTPDEVLGRGNRQKRMAEEQRKKWLAKQTIRKSRSPQMEAPEWLLGVIHDNELLRKGMIN
jgi:hypothetical protein